MLVKAPDTLCHEALNAYEKGMADQDAVILGISELIDIINEHAPHGYNVDPEYALTILKSRYIYCENACARRPEHIYSPQDTIFYGSEAFTNTFFRVNIKQRRERSERLWGSVNANRKEVAHVAEI